MTNPEGRLPEGAAEVDLASVKGLWMERWEDVRNRTRTAILPYKGRSGGSPETMAEPKVDTSIKGHRKKRPRRPRSLVT